MPTRMPKNGPRSNREGDNNELKIHVSRVPTKFDEVVVLRILKEHLLDGDEQQNESSEDPIHVELVYPREESNDDNDDDGAKKSAYDGGQDDDHTGGDGLPVQSESKGDQPKEHRGFGFVTLQTKKIYDKALALSTIRGGRKPGSKKQYTMHIRRYTTSPDETDVCYLWAKQRCPYGDECKFSHSGPGACLVRREADEATKQSKKGKCFAYKKGKCSLGDDCPFSHDYEPSAPAKDDGDKKERTDTLQSEKDCINWKTKGKCRKGEKCPYRHDPDALKKVEAKKNKRKRPSDEEGIKDTKKQKQPLCVRVFGMAYDTTVEDIRNFFEHCGTINELTFPTFEDSGRSKGYCGLVFASPKAVEKAIELNGAELLGRWLSVQAGKMYLRDWETNHTRSREQAADGSPS